MSGEISCGFRREQVDYKVGRGRDTTLLINGGGLAAQFASVSGDITIRPAKSQGFGFGAPAPTTDLSRMAGHEGGAAEDITEPEGHVARQEAELEILQALERGEISSQEALRRLSELGG